MAGRRLHWLGITFLVMIVQLLVWNLYTIRRNQHVLPAWETIHVNSGNIVTVAMKNPADVVNKLLATFYYLRLLSGKTLVIP